MDLPSHTLPEIVNDDNYNYNKNQERQVNNTSKMNMAVDSDYTVNNTHRKSVTGLSLQMAEGSIIYKTRFQDTMALSSTKSRIHSSSRGW